MGDGARHRGVGIEHTLDTENQTNVGMEKADLGPITFMFCEVSFCMRMTDLFLRFYAEMIVILFR